MEALIRDQNELKTSLSLWDVLASINKMILVETNLHGCMFILKQLCILSVFKKIPAGENFLICIFQNVFATGLLLKVAMR